MIQQEIRMSYQGRLLRNSLFVALGLILACILPAFAFAADQDHAELVKVAALPGGFAPYWPCGDLNGRCQVYGTWAGANEDLLICEDTSGNSFRCVQTGVKVGWVCDVGDGDGDSLCDLICHPTNLQLQVWEATAPDSFPSQLVFDYRPPISVEYAQLCDLDRDGEQEIVFNSRNGDGVYVLENQGDNQYVEVPFPRRSGVDDIMGMFVVGDFDLDGHTELVGGNANGEILLYECIGDDQYARVCSLSYAPNQREDYRHTVANDMDGNGLPELVSLFRRTDTQADSCLVRIYEEPAHNQLVCVCSLTFAYNPFWGGCVAAGDVDGSGRDMFAVSTNLDVRLFKSNGLHQYAQTWQLNWPGVNWMRFFDINQDGRDELIISRSDSTYILEDTNGLGTAIFEPPTQRRSHAVSVQPTIARLGASLQFSGVPPGADIEVLGLDGRSVSRAPGVRQSSWAWNLRDQTGNLVPTGTYFAVIRSKGKATSLKLCVVK
jgi:hypothetical protein